MAARAGGGRDDGGASIAMARRSSVGIARLAVTSEASSSKR